MDTIPHINRVYAPSMRLLEGIECDNCLLLSVRIVGHNYTVNGIVLTLPRI